MLIDFHTHFFPDKIAKESVEKLARKANVKYYGDGTLSGLLQFMKQDSVDISINQPVATKPEQVKSINRKMIELNAKKLGVMCFGSLHPDFDGFEDELAFIAANGIKGIKMHPEYQVFCPEEIRMFKIYEGCVKNNLAVLFHAGADIGYTCVHCTPKGIKEVLAVKGLKVILAHMGVYKMWDDVEKYLVGKNVYFDTAYCTEIENSQFRRMILNHGSDKILFATDFPWESASSIKAKIEQLDLSQKDIDNIFYKNAAKLLSLNV
jgi:hypothetical protein